MWAWGTTLPTRHSRWPGEVHLLWPLSPSRQPYALCGVLADEAWESRPAANGRGLCPECCQHAINAMFPAPPDHGLPLREPGATNPPPLIFPPNQ